MPAYFILILAAGLLGMVASRFNTHHVILILAITAAAAALSALALKEVE